MKVTVEVSAAEVVNGVVEIKGTIAFSDDVILFDYQTTNMARQVSDEKRIRVSVSALQEIEFKSGVVSSKIILHPKRLDIMEEMPGAHSDKMVFHVKRDDQDEADALVSTIKNRLYELGESGLDSVPFQLADTNWGLTEHSGLLHLDEEFLVFEIHSGITGGPKSESQIIKVEPTALEAIRLHRGKLKDSLYLKPKKEALLSAIPGEHKTEVRLRIAKQHRRASERMVSRIRHVMDEGDIGGG